MFKKKMDAGPTTAPEAVATPLDFSAEEPAGAPPPYNSNPAPVSGDAQPQLPMPPEYQAQVSFPDEPAPGPVEQPAEAPYVAVPMPVEKAPVDEKQPEDKGKHGVAAYFGWLGGHEKDGAPAKGVKIIDDQKIVQFTKRNDGHSSGMGDSVQQQFEPEGMKDEYLEVKEQYGTAQETAKDDEGTFKSKQGLSTTELVINACMWTTLIVMIVGLAQKKVAMWVIPLLIHVGLVIYCLTRTPTSKYMRNIIKTAEGAEEYVEDLRCTPPELLVKMQCYHYETVYNTTKHSDGSKSTTKSRERVDTWQGAWFFEYGYAKELSGICKVVGKADIIKLRLYDVIKFGDETSRKAWKQQKARFIRHNKYRDKHFEVSTECYIPGLKRRMITLKNPDHRPLHLRYFSYFCMVVISLPYVYTVILKRISIKVGYEFVKEMYVR